MGTVCSACAQRHRFRWAVVQGACEEHRHTVPADAPIVEHEWIVEQTAEGVLR
jgi:hypothetical protein